MCIYIYPMWCPIISHENLHLTIRHKMSIESMEGVLDDWQSHNSTFGHKMCEFQWRSVELNSTIFPLLCWYRSTRIHGINMSKHFFQTCTFRKLRLVRLIRPCTCQKVPVSRPHWQMLLLGDCDYFSHPTPIWGSYQQHAPCSVSSRCCCVERKKPPDKNLCTL